MTDLSKLDTVLKHAQLAHFDNELTSFVIIMIANGDPEVHMAISPDDTYKVNAGLDMFKLEMLKIIQDGAEIRKPRT